MQQSLDKIRRARNDEDVQGAPSGLSDDGFRRLLGQVADDDLGKLLSFHLSDPKMTHLLRHIRESTDPGTWRTLATSGHLGRCFMQQRNTEFNRNSLPYIDPMMEQNVLPLTLAVTISWEQLADVSKGVMRMALSQPNARSVVYNYGQIIKNTVELIRKDAGDVLEWTLVGFPEAERRRMMRWIVTPPESGDVKVTKWPPVREAVVGSSSKFVWDDICKKKRSDWTIADVMQLRRHLSDNHIPYQQEDNVRQLCRHLAQLDITGAERL